MSLNNIELKRQNGETRAFLESFNEINDKNPKTLKSGIRSHHWFTAFFLKILGKIETIRTLEGKVYYLNKNSFNQWKERHAAELNLQKGNNAKTLPSAEDIISAHKQILKKEKGSKEELAATLLQKHVRGYLQRSKFSKLKEATLTAQKLLRGNKVRKKYEELKALKAKINSLKEEIKIEKAKIPEMKKASDEALNELREKTEKLKKEKAELEEELPKALSELSSQEEELKKLNEINKNLKSSVKESFKNLFGKIKKNNQPHEDKESIELQEKAIQSKKEKVFEIEQNLEEKNQLIADFEKNIATESLEKEEIKKQQLITVQKEEELKKQEKELDALILQMNSVGQSSAPSRSSSKVFLKVETYDIPSLKSIPKLTKKRSGISSVNPIGSIGVKNKSFENFLNDVEQHAHKELERLMSVLVNKFGSDSIKNWEFDKKTGNFKLILDNQKKLWIRPTKKDTGKPDGQTPRGVVLIYGDNQGVVEGKIEKGKNTLEFSKGIKSYCKYKMNFLIGGEADGEINKIQYSNNGKIAVHVNGKDRISGIGKKDIDEKKADTLINDWSQGHLIEKDHENYLKKQPIRA